MNDTILVLSTHFIDEAIISEYRKMQNTPNVDILLAVDNNNYKHNINEKGRIQDITFFGTKVHCFFFDSELHEEMELPYFTFHGIDNFGKNMWANGDYRYYYLKKYFKNYKYYWIMEYDLFCNGNTYAVFLDKFNDNNSDFLVCGFRKEKKEGPWYWTYGLDWIYKDDEIYGSFFPIVRLSANAIDFLYQRRLEHKKVFEISKDPKKRWIFCELFVPTELMNNGFSCEKISDEKHVTLNPIHLNDNRIFTMPDNHLYHPVKSTINEITKLNNEISVIKRQYQELLNLFKKVFFIQFVRSLNETNSLQFAKYGIQFEKNFNFVLIPLTEDAGLRYEAHFSNDSIQMLLNFQGKYVDEYLNKVVTTLKNAERMQHFTLYNQPKKRGGGYWNTSHGEKN